MEVWWVGTATLLMRIGPLTVLTDPVFNETPTSRYPAGFGLYYERTERPMPPAELGPIDLVLISHDQHGDNLDEAGRALLPQAGQVLTTKAGAGRLEGNVRGLAPFESTTLEKDGFRLKVTATPARHGPRGSLPFVGPVIGFVLEWEGQQDGALYISGDTVHYGELDKLAEHFRIGGAILHVGAARFPILGRLTLGGDGAAKLARALDPAWIVPVHCGSWSHFSESPEETARQLQEEGLGERVRWLRRGEWTTLPL
jgi:L-ascorbate metabolism protein UlaG (beta-lactamase superfamily)